MTADTTDRFKVLVGREEYADHILDTAGADPDKRFEEFKQLMPDNYRDAFEEMASETDPAWGVFASHWMPGDLMCSHSSKRFATTLCSLSEYAAAHGLDNLTFDDDAPDRMCSYCWSKTKKTLNEEAELEEDGIYDRIGTVGYRLRWKQKGRAREEWYDIVVCPETTMAELDSLVFRFSTLDNVHLRMYGLEDEYLDSSLQVLPDLQHSVDPSYTKASEITIAEVAEQATLWEGDRLSLVYDFGTPSHYYCIVKEVYDQDELDSLLAKENLLAETETAAIIDEKRP